MRTFGVCSHCRSEAYLYTSDGRCAPCRYRDSKKTIKHEFQQQPVVQEEMHILTIEEIQSAIAKEYVRENCDEAVIKELFAEKRKLRAYLDRERFTYSNYYDK